MMALINSDVFTELAVGKRVTKLVATRYREDVEIEKDLDFLSCCGCYLFLDGDDTPINFCSYVSDSKYTLLLERLEENEYAERTKEISSYMLDQTLEDYCGKIINSASIYKEKGDFVSYSLSLSEGIELVISAGRRFEAGDSYVVEGPDEDIIIFDSQSTARSYGLAP
ncbi:MAG: hypothetical protein ACRBB6_07770 [Neptuniibacter sp.]